VKIKPGMNAKISLDAYANSTFTGTVSSVSPTPVESSNVVSYTAKILMPSIDKEVYSNMSATVQIIVAEKNDVLTIPTKAIKSDKGKTYVQVLNGVGTNATTIQTEVTLGTTDDASVEVISGVTSGQKLKIQTTSSTGTTTRTSTSGFG
jgi:multidrug efflux pump subunit AcrA (membrane-fusion protein)